jgi:trk system potassium uptake protein TrkA
MIKFYFILLCFVYTSNCIVIKDLCDKKNLKEKGCLNGNCCGKVLESLGIRNFENVIIAIGDNIQASILTTLLIKEIGVKNVYVKAKNNYLHKVLEKIGADKVVHPETDMGRRIAQQMSDEYSIVELNASANLEGSSLVELNIRARFGITIPAIKKVDDIKISPMPE